MLSLVDTLSSVFITENCISLGSELTEVYKKAVHIEKSTVNVVLMIALFLPVHFSVKDRVVTTKLRKKLEKTRLQFGSL